MTTTVLVPDEQAIAALAGVPVRAVRYTSLDELPDAEILVPGIGVPAGSDVATRLPSLRLVQLLTAGVDGWVGKVPGHILLSSGRGAHGAPTAEWAMTALLTVYRQFREFEDLRREGRWDPWPTESLMGKRVLVIGAGDLGRDLHRKLTAFDAEPVLVGTTARDGVRAVADLPSLLPTCDAVVLVVPMTSATHHLVDARFLAQLPDRAIVVNAARGPVVDTDALLAELESGRLRAALDVTDPEPLPAGHPLWTAPGLLLTPHLGGRTEGSRDRAYRVMATQIARYLETGTTDNLVRGEY